MPAFADVYERIKLATNCRTQMELAAVLDIRQSSISDAKRRNTVPGDWFMKLFERFGLNPDWLKQGSGPMYLRTDKGYVPSEKPEGLAEDPAHFGDPQSRCVICPVFLMSCPYSDGKARPAFSPAGRLAIPGSLQRDGLMVFRMSAGNMAPLLPPNAHFGVDSNDQEIISGKLYAVFAPHEGVTVRKIFLDGEQEGYLLRSESAQYPETRLTPQQLKKRLLGRVIWIMQEL